MTHPDTPRPPMSETVKPLSQEELDEQRALEPNGSSAVFRGRWLATIADLEAKLEKAERDLAQSREMNEKLRAYVAGRAEFARSQCKTPVNGREMWAILHSLINMIDKKSLDAWQAVEEMTPEEREECARELLAPPTTGSAP